MFVWCQEETNLVIPGYPLPSVKTVSLSPSHSLFVHLLWILVKLKECTRNPWARGWELKDVTDALLVLTKSTIQFTRTAAGVPNVHLCHPHEISTLAASFRFGSGLYIFIYWAIHLHGTYTYSSIHIALRSYTPPFL